MTLTLADIERIEALAKATLDEPPTVPEPQWSAWLDASNAFDAATDPATVLELVRLARLGMDQEATARAQYSVPEQPQWRGLAAADPAAR